MMIVFVPVAYLSHFNSAFLTTDILIFPTTMFLSLRVSLFCCFLRVCTSFLPLSDVPVFTGVFSLFFFFFFLYFFFFFFSCFFSKYVPCFFFPQWRSCHCMFFFSVVVLFKYVPDSFVPTVTSCLYGYLFSAVTLISLLDTGRRTPPYLLFCCCCFVQVCTFFLLPHSDVPVFTCVFFFLSLSFFFFFFFSPVYFFCCCCCFLQVCTFFLLPHSDIRVFTGVSFLPQVFDYGYPPGPDEGCAVFQFPSLKNAEVFFQCDKRIRQPDFPPPQGHAEIFAISLQSDPNTMQSEQPLSWSLVPALLLLLFRVVSDLWQWLKYL